MGVAWFSQRVLPQQLWGQLADNRVNGFTGTKLALVPVSLTRVSVLKTLTDPTLPV